MLLGRVLFQSTSNDSGVPLNIDVAVELAGARLAAMLFGTSLYTWASTIGDIRKTAAERQKQAREEAEKAGIKVVDPKPADLKAAREKLMAAQDAIIEATGIDPAFVKKAQEALNKAGS